ncbi:MAG: molybdenum cofactor guanylyltransferase MobA [Pseudomonadales bacterium]
MHHKISAIILAGGEGSRMNYANKGLMEFHSKPLIASVLERLHAQVDDIVISANRDVETFVDQFGHPVVADRGESHGPLSGIAAAAPLCQHDLIFISACDTPYLPLDIVAILRRGLRGEATMVIADDKIEPLVCLATRNAVAEINPLLERGQRSVMNWLNQVAAVPTPVTARDHRAFYNINRASDLDG